MYRWFMDLRNTLYDHQKLKTEKLNVPVVSVGNLTTGGTGKTPFIDMLLKHFSDKYICGVACRNYKGSSKYSGLVRVDSRDPKVVGDEALLLADENLSSLIFSGSSKTDSAHSLEKLGTEIIFVDDGFQHRRLQRDCDIVLLDASVPISHYRVLPWGHMRESWKGLERANMIVLTKMHAARLDTYVFLRTKIAMFHPEDENIFHAFYHFRHLPPKDEKIFLVAGIARPEGFLSRFHPDQIVGKQIFPDHYNYTLQDILTIETLAKKKGATSIYMTEKDKVKIQSLLFSEESRGMWKTLSLEMVVKERKEFYEHLEFFLD
jgi:tetraacyldisaccharide 4'-kinase